MDVSAFLSLGCGLVVTSVESTATTLTCFVSATAPAPGCPLCHEPSDHLHSHYQRVVADLPCGGRQVTLILLVRKFRCKTKACPRKVFAERFAPLIEPWARQSTRLIEALQAIGLATCGEGGARLAAKLSLPASSTTLLRRIMALPDVTPEPVQELGIDDFSFRRGWRFGTILVDLERHRAIDLLPDRQAETAAAWMRQRPTIRVVSRDRGGDYAAAATQGAPQAVQCADRFHLLKNLGEAVEGLLAHHLAAERKRQIQAPQALQTPVWLTKRSVRYSATLVRRQQARREERLARYEQVIALRQLGLSQQAIARQVGIGASTVQSWLAVSAFPERKPRQQSSQLDRYLPYLIQRWAEGCHNIACLFRELVEQGYKGSYESVYDNLVRLLPEGRKHAAAVSQTPALATSRQAAFLFLRRPEDLGEEERETITKLRQMNPEVDLAYGLVQQFAQMLRSRMGVHLDAWLAQAASSKLPELQSFAAGIEKDKEAVRNGLTWSINNGMVEGFVTKLKLIKRTMYGRASFALLRQRVLHAA